MKKRSFSKGRHLSRWQRRHGRRAFLKASVIAGTAATGVTALSGNLFAGTAQAATAHQQIAADQLGTLTTFYADMDASAGPVNLLSTNVSYLMAEQATLTNGLTVSYMDGGNLDKGASVTNWTATNQQFSWPVQATLADQYVVTALIFGTAGTTVQVTVGASSCTYTFTASAWNKIQLGQVALPTGGSTLTVQATAGSGINMQLYSLELVPASVQAQVNAAVQSGRSKATWMRNSSVGAMYQWGQWGANPDGTQPAWPQCYANFDYNGFADRMQSMGVDFVVWSITWTQYFVAAPIASIDAVLAGRTTTNYGGADYLGQLLQALQSRGIRVIFYYHEGHDNNPNLDWWNAFWTSQVPSAGYYARREKAINAWLNIIAEIGNRYGTLLDGWMFDDGPYYYPAPYDLVNQALRAGNADRLISFNFHPTRLTDYEDFFFGEDNTGSFFNPSTIVNGRYTQGPFVNEYAFGNFTVDQGDWGVRTGDTSPITTALSRDQFVTIAENAIQTGQAMAYDTRMWTNMTQAQTDIDYLTDAATLAHAIRDGNLYNDTDSSITYSGTGWYAQGANGTYNGDIHATTINGDSFVFTFYGTGVDFVTETYSGYGNIDIYIDGTYTTTVSASGTSTPFHQLFIYRLDGLVLGTHTLKGVKTSGAFMIVDAFNVRRVDPSQWYKLVIQNNPSYVLDTSTTANGGMVQMWAYQADDRQQYQFVPVGAGYYKLAIRNNPAYVVDATLPVADGTQIQAWLYQGDTRQQYRLVNQGNGYYHLFVRYSPDYLLDAEWVNDGGKVQLWHDAGNDRQRWSLVTVS